MLGVVYVVGVNHALQVFAAFGRPPFNALVYDNIVKNDVEDAVQQNAQGYCKAVRAVVYHTKIIE
jgi:hypothetical protein